MTCRAAGPRRRWWFAASGLASVLLVGASTGWAQDERSALDRQVDAAVVKALKFLRDVQSPTGGWVVDQYHGDATSAASLAMMSFLAAGHVPGEGAYAPTLDRGLDYLLQRQEANGLLVDRRGHGPMYCHGISTLFLAEVAGMVPDDRQVRVRQALERAVKLILTSQAVVKLDRHRGGWRYTPASQDSDLSVTGWQLLALRAAKDLGCDVPAENIDQALEYVKACRGHDGHGYGYQPQGNMTPTLSGTALVALEVCGEHDTVDTRRSVDYLMARPLRAQDDWYFYGAYYCSIGLYKHGGEAWPEQKTFMYNDLLAMQNDDGSWSGQGNEQPFGKVYCTSMAVLALTVEYGYLPIYQR